MLIQYCPWNWARFEWVETMCGVFPQALQVTNIVLIQFIPHSLSIMCFSNLIHTHNVLCSQWDMGGHMWFRTFPRLHGSVGYLLLYNLNNSLVIAHWKWAGYCWCSVAERCVRTAVPALVASFIVELEIWSRFSLGQWILRIGRRFAASKWITARMLCCMRNVACVQRVMACNQALLCGMCSNTMQQHCGCHLGDLTQTPWTQIDNSGVVVIFVSG